MLTLPNTDFFEIVLDLVTARKNVSQLLDIWSDETRDIENELERWGELKLHTSQRDHWTSNGILPRIISWRKMNINSIRWVCTEGHGRQSWLTEFSLDLILVCQSQRQMVTFALCDRPKGVHWNPQVLMKHLICQLLHLNPTLSLENPGIFDIRAFRRAINFKQTTRLLASVIARLPSLLIVIDRLDLCWSDPDPENSGKQNIARVLSDLVKQFPNTLRVIVTTGQVVTTAELPSLAASIATIITRQRPRRKYEEYEKAIRQRRIKSKKNSVHHKKRRT